MRMAVMVNIYGDDDDNDKALVIQHPRNLSTPKHWGSSP